MIKEAIASLVDRKPLSANEASIVMEEIMDGQATPSQLSAFIIALKMKGETVEEITGMARTMRSKAIAVNTAEPVVDIVGTGGDGSSTFNISTAAALVVAGAGLKVAKHGNRAATSRCGSADVLESLGVRIDLNAAQAAECLKRIGITYMFAPAFHPAMKHAGPTRREIGVPSVFNILGPLTNPAGAEHYLMGVARRDLVSTMAGVLKNLGCRHGLVVHGEDGLDEITICGRSVISEISLGGIVEYEVSPENFGMTLSSIGEIKGGDADENAYILRRVLSGQPGPCRDIVLLNAGAGLFVGDMVSSIAEGVRMAEGVLDSGRAMSKLADFIDFTRSLS